MNHTAQNFCGSLSTWSPWDTAAQNLGSVSAGCMVTMGQQGGRQGEGEGGREGEGEHSDTYRQGIMRIEWKNLHLLLIVFEFSLFCWPQQRQQQQQQMQQE